MTVNRIDRSRADANEDFIIFRRRLSDLLELEVVDTVLTIHNSFHRIGRNGRVAIAVVSGSPVGDEEPADEHEQDNRYGPLNDALNELHWIVIAIFPCTWPVSRYLYAAAVSVNG